MGIKNELEAKVKSVFSDNWTKRRGNVIPTYERIGLGNEGVEIEGTVLYADLSSSTSLVDKFKADFAAEVYKTYLYCAAKIIRSEGGEITSYDGDRIMAVFLGDTKEASAVRAALKINGVVLQTINPGIKKEYGARKYTVKQVVGIDTSKLLVAKTGIRGANDLVWVGRAANYAAKLCNLAGDPTFITNTVYNKLSDATKYSDKNNMWKKFRWKEMNDMLIYSSDYFWEL